MTHPFHDALVLTGPTGSGKSAIALELAVELGAEIVALDSMTLYRGMDLGTAKPTLEERARVPHHLIDVLDPWESANVAWWLAQARMIVDDLRQRGKRALFVGGTPFYLKALVSGLFEAPPCDPAIRPRLEAEAEQIGPLALHERLRQIDPVTAERLHPNDVRRVIRALEVWEATGQPISQLQQQWGVDPADAPRCAVLTWPRDELYQRIDRRVVAMLEAGWLEEARRLLALPRPLSKESSQALGYRDLFAYLQGEEPDWATTVSTIQMRTRQFAKRQLTWFRGLPGCVPVAADDPGVVGRLIRGYSDGSFI